LWAALVRMAKEVNGDPWAGLAAAIVLQAVTEARGGDHGAESWLLTEGQLWLEALGLDIHPDRLGRWVSDGCPKRAR